jgi:hypothetical protein
MLRAFMTKEKFGLSDETSDRFGLSLFQSQIDLACFSFLYTNQGLFRVINRLPLLYYLFDNPKGRAVAPSHHR